MGIDFLEPTLTTKSCIFIDGENFRHSIIDLFQTEFNQQDHLPLSALWETFFNYLTFKTHKSTRVRTYWYVTGEIDFWPWEFPLRDEGKLVNILSQYAPWAERYTGMLKEDKQKFINDTTGNLISERKKMTSRFNGWNKIHNGITLKTDSLEFRKSGVIRYNLFTKQFGSEKAVDVKLAVDLLELRPIYDTAIIVSGDGDYVPAVQRLKDSGKKVINVSFKTRGGKVLPGGAYRLNLMTDEILEIPYEAMNYFMGFSKTPPGNLI